MCIPVRLSSSSRWGHGLGAIVLVLPAIAAGVSLSSAPVMASPTASPSTQTTTITTVGETPYAVPASAYALQVTVVGSAGASIGGNPTQPDGAAGSGAEVQATITPPTGVPTLYVEVGSASEGPSPAYESGGGTTGYGGGGYSDFGGAGGGASDIQTCSASAAGCTDTAVPATDPRLLVAGGGGGGGENGFLNGTGGAGGSAGSAGTTVTGPGAGGGGASPDGLAGSGAGLGDSATAAAGGPGDASVCPTLSGGIGSPGQGGIGEDDVEGDGSMGAGGGGGWVGGSGGGEGGCYEASGAGGGGGGGASYVEASATDVSVSTAGATSPEVIIVAELAVAPALTSADGTTFTIGQAGTFSVAATGGPVPALSDGAATLPSGVTFADNGDGTATLAGTPAAGTVGSYPFTITASNGTDPDATQDFTLTVAQAATTISVTSSPNPSTAGEAVTITATVQLVAGSGTPTGSVTISVDGYPIGTVALDSGQATLSTSTLAAGTHAITAVYAGNASYAGSVTATTDLQVVTVPVPATGAGAAAAPTTGAGIPLLVLGGLLLLLATWRRRPATGTPGADGLGGR